LQPATVSLPWSGSGVELEPTEVANLRA